MVERAAVESRVPGDRHAAGVVHRRRGRAGVTLDLADHSDDDRIWQQGDGVSTPSNHNPECQ